MSLADPLTGAGLGLLGGLGAALVLAAVPAWRRPSLDARLAPYLREARRTDPLAEPTATLTPFPTVERLLAPTLRDAGARLQRLLGGQNALRRRLEQAGGSTTIETFRSEQVLWAAGGLFVGLAVSLLGLARAASGAAGGGATMAASPLFPVVVSVAGAVAGAVARDQWLTHQITVRERRLLAEFPTVAELLALSVSAGEGAAGALERVCRLTRGEMSAELGRALADARAGAGLVGALEGMAARTSLPALARFVDGVTVALERGTPLAEVLRAQAVDVREAGRRELLETGGRREIAMMVPVVFLVLPVTIAFALYPGLITLQLTV